MMARTTCEDQEKFRSKGGNCCDVCDAGRYVKAECDDNKATQCAPCEDGLYTATRNHMSSCRLCRVCSENQRTEKKCTRQEDTVCACVSGFFCSNDTCDHCQPVSVCRLGEGVALGATRTNNTVCAPCEDGTYSDVTDSQSRCLPHISCEEFGRVLKTPGTRTSNAICGDFKGKCQWMLPAGLWSGLVLTALVLFLLVCWRKNRKSHQTAAVTTPPGAEVDMMPVAEEQMRLDLPLPATEQKSCYQDGCTTVSCAVELFQPDQELADGSGQESLDSCRPITPVKVSVFVDSAQGNGSADYCTSTFFRSHSEPQEDEWCGT